MLIVFQNETIRWGKATNRHLRLILLCYPYLGGIEEKPDRHYIWRFGFQGNRCL